MASGTCTPRAHGWPRPYGSPLSHSLLWLRSKPSLTRRSNRTTTLLTSRARIFRSEDRRWSWSASRSLSKGKAFARWPTLGSSSCATVPSPASASSAASLAGRVAMLRYETKTFPVSVWLLGKFRRRKWESLELYGFYAAFGQLKLVRFC